ncbi:MAG TPA: hypothetical protein VFG54_12320 [Prolixibacteraceae bacterium]|nr:hypothetical protein [Prolixibacteraceae bacterium]
MTIIEFDNTAFTANSKAVYKGDSYEIATVNFEEKLIGLEDPHDKVFDEDGEESPAIYWVRCENCKMI